MAKAIRFCLEAWQRDVAAGDTLAGLDDWIRNEVDMSGIDCDTWFMSTDSWNTEPDGWFYSIRGGKPHGPFQTRIDARAAILVTEGVVC